MSFPGSLANESDFQVETAKVTTTDATVTTLWSKAVPKNGVVVALAQVVTINADGSERAAYTRTMSAYRAAGDVTALGAVATLGTDGESTVGMDCTMDVDTTTQSLRVRVTGKAATTLNWRCRVQLVRG